METIASFTVDHLTLEPGIYLSRQDAVGDRTLNSYDLRFTRPNREPVMNTGEMHTIEHLAATYLRNHPDYSDQVIYFGPMGCRTGFYVIFTDAIPQEEIKSLIVETFEFVRDFEGEIPGAKAEECGNYLDHNLTMAKWYADRYLTDLSEQSATDFSY